MTGRRSAIVAIVGAFVLGLLPGRAADLSARGFVAGIYNAYTGKNAKGVSLGSDAAIRRYFEPKLASLIIGDRHRAARRGDVPELDGDPFVDAQDWEIKSVDIAMHDVTPDKAGATVSFRNADEMKTIELDLVRLGQGWRIAGIAWDGKQTLRELLAKP